MAALEGCPSSEGLALAAIFHACLRLCACTSSPTLLIVPTPPQFRAWLGRHGPFGAVIDGANVALYGQNFDTGGFNFGQIQAVVNHLASRHPDLKPLLMLHVGRTKAPQASLAHEGWQAGPALLYRVHEAATGWRGCGLACLGCGRLHHPSALLLLQAKAPEAQALLKELSGAHSFYVTPAGSNDDWWVAGWLGVLSSMSGALAELGCACRCQAHAMHQPAVLLLPLYCRRYWIYAAVTAGEHGLLISNDEMRDHIFQVAAAAWLAGLVTGWVTVCSVASGFAGQHMQQVRSGLQGPALLR